LQKLQKIYREENQLKLFKHLEEEIEDVAFTTKNEVSANKGVKR
jgi:hypothetical protein